MGEPQCRFCLDDTETPDNPLISPCACAGSVRYVHHLCLRRWTAARPTTAHLCPICQSLYSLEVLPTGTTVFFLNNCAIIGTVVIYASPPGQIREVHLAFQALYFAAVTNVFSVRDYRLYARQQEPYYAIAYLFLLNELIKNNTIVCCFLINIVLFLAWLEHLRILRG
jgi:hypothetical protein